MSISKNSISNFVGFIFPLFVTFFTVPYYLDFIGDERYGVLAVIWVVFGYFGFLDIGLGRATTQKIAKLSKASAKERNDLFWTAFLLTFLIGILGGLVLWFFADQLLSFIGNVDSQLHGELKSAVLWLLPALLFLLTTSVMSGALQGRERFLEINIISVTGNILTQFLPLFSAWMGYVGLQYLVPIALFGRFISSFFLYFQCKVHVPLVFPFEFKKNEVKNLLSYGGWVSIIGMIAPFLVIVDRLVISSILGAKAVTYYTIPYSISSKALQISSSIAIALFPRFSASPEDARELANWSTHILTALMTPVVIIGIALFESFIIFWVGEDFSKKSEGVGEIILCGVWFNALVVPHLALLRANEDLKRIFVVYLIQIPIYFAMLWFGITYWGIQGAALAWLLRVIIDVIMLLCLAKAFRVSLYGNKLNFGLVLSAFMVSMFTEQHLIEYWIQLGSILLVSIVINWSTLLFIVCKILDKK